MKPVIILTLFCILIPHSFARICRTSPTSSLKVQDLVNDSSCTIIEIAPGQYKEALVINRDLIIRGDSSSSDPKDFVLYHMSDNAVDVRRSTISVILEKLRVTNYSTPLTTSATSGSTAVSGSYGEDGHDTFDNLEPGEPEVSNSSCIITYGKLFLSNVVVSNCKSTADGAAIRVWNDAHLSVVNSRIEENESEGNGGAIHLGSNAYLYSSKTTFSKNIAYKTNGASYGGAISAYESKAIILKKTSFFYNLSITDGGAIFARRTPIEIEESFFNTNGYLGTPYLLNQRGGAIQLQESPLTVSKTHFRFNMAQKNGGAIYAVSSPIVSIDSEYLINITHDPTTSSEGGAIKLQSSNYQGTGNGFYGNVANTGGAIYADESNLEEKGSTYLKNVAWGNGGAAIYTLAIDDSYKLDLQDSQFYGNVAGNSFYGGAVAIISKINAFINRTSFIENESYMAGGALTISSSHVSAQGNLIEIRNSTIANNINHQRHVGAGGIAVATDADVIIANSTLYQNEATRKGANNLYFYDSHDSGQLTVSNSVIYSDPAMNARPDCDFLNYNSYGQYNMIGNNIDGDSSCGANITQNPDLAFRYHGFPLSYSARGPHSPILDTGDSATCTMQDTWKNRRGADGNGDGISGCDIGAVEDMIYMNSLPNERDDDEMLMPLSKGLELKEIKEKLQEKIPLMELEALMNFNKL